MSLQPGRLGSEPPGARGREPVVPAQPPVHDLLPLGRHEALVAEPVERAVEGAGAEHHPARGQPADLLDHPVPVHGFPGEGGEDEEGGFLERAGHDR